MNKLFENLNKLVEKSVIDSNEFHCLTSVRKKLFKELEYKDTAKFIVVSNYIDMLCVHLLNENIDIIIPKVDKIR